MEAGSRRVGDRAAVRRPVGIESFVDDLARILSGGAHDEQAATVPVRAERDALPVGGIGGVEVLPSLVRGQVDGASAPDPLGVDVRVAGHQRPDAGGVLDEDEVAAVG